MGAIDACSLLKLGGKGLLYFIWLAGWTALTYFVGSLMIWQVVPYYLNDWTEVTCVGARSGVNGALACDVAEGACRGWGLPPGLHLTMSNFTSGDAARVYVDAGCENWEWQRPLRELAVPSMWGVLLPILHMTAVFVVWWVSLIMFFFEAVAQVRACARGTLHNDEDDNDDGYPIASGMAFGGVVYCTFFLTTWSLSMHMLAAENDRVADLKAHPARCTPLTTREVLDRYVDVRSGSCKIVRAYMAADFRPETFDCYVASDCSSADDDPDAFDTTGRMIGVGCAMAVYACGWLGMVYVYATAVKGELTGEQGDPKAPPTDTAGAEGTDKALLTATNPMGYPGTNPFVPIPVDAFVIDVTTPPNGSDPAGKPVPIPFSSLSHPHPHPLSAAPSGGPPVHLHARGSRPPSQAGSGVGLDGSRDLQLTGGRMVSPSASTASYGRGSVASPGAGRCRM